MSELKGHFGGIVESQRIDDDGKVAEVSVRVDTVCPLGFVEKGALVDVSRENFAPMGAGPYPAKGAHVEGNVVRETQAAPNQYKNLTAIV